MSDSYRADHVGSFLRPPELLEARRARIPMPELEALENRHISRVLQKQREIGLEVFTDGELRRSNFMSDFTDAVDGFDSSASVPRSWSDDAQKSSTPYARRSSISGIVTSALKQRQPLTGREMPFLREHAPGPIKITLPSATQFPAISFKYGITDAVYRDPYAMLDAITGIMAEDVKDLAGREFRICRLMRRVTATSLTPSGLHGWRRNCESIRRRCLPLLWTQTTLALLPQRDLGSHSRSTCAVVTIGATGMRRAGTMRLQNDSSTNLKSIGFSWSMTMNAQAASNR